MCLNYLSQATFHFQVLIYVTVIFDRICLLCWNIIDIFGTLEVSNILVFFLHTVFAGSTFDTIVYIVTTLHL